MPRSTRLIGSVLVFAALAGLVWLLHGEEIEDALHDFPLPAAAAAVCAQLAWLNFRGEAWRVSLNAADPARAPRAAAHSANALAFLVGQIQQAATVPVRAIALRRLAPESTPHLPEVLVADAPVLALEGTLMGLILVAVALTAPGFPLWGAALILGGAVAIMAALMVTREHFHGRGWTAGLGVFADRRRRAKLVALCVGMSALALTRSWLILSGFDLPDGFASAALFLAALGVLGALPIGPTASPAAALALFGGANASAAAAAGIAVLFTSLAATTIYGVVWLVTLALMGKGPIDALRRRQPGEAPA